MDPCSDRLVDDLVVFTLIWFPFSGVISGFMIFHLTLHVFTLKYLVTDRVACKQEEVRQYYIDVVEPMLRAAPTRPRLGYEPLDGSTGSASDTYPRPYEVSFPGYCHAYSLVSTRAFWVDAFHGLAMVPIADA